MGENRIYLRHAEILDEIRDVLVALNATTTRAVDRASEMLTTAGRYLEERFSYWEREYRYWGDRLYNPEGQIDQYAREKMDIAEDKMSVIKRRIDQAQVHGETLQRIHTAASVLDTKVNQGAAFLSQKKEQATTIMTMRSPQISYSGSNRAPFSSARTVSSGGVGNTGSTLQEFASGIQKRIIVQYGSDIMDIDKKREPIEVSKIPFWRLSKWSAVGQYYENHIDVRVDAVDKDRVVTHETFHRMSDNGYKGDFSYAGLSLSCKDVSGFRVAHVSLNEGVTELYTRRYVEANGIPSKNSYYMRNVDLAARLESVVGSATLSKAYFRSETGLLSNIFSGAFGDQRAFVNFSKLVDKACGSGGSNIDNPESALAYLEAQKMLIQLRKNLLERER